MRRLALACLAACTALLATPVAAQPPEAQVDAPSEEARPKAKKRKRARLPKPEKTATKAEKAAPTPVEAAPAPPVEAAKTPVAAKIESAPAPSPPPDLLPELVDTTTPSKLAITSFQVEGDEAPAALVYQLQDGFILGLVRAGVRVIDTEDLKNRLKDEPDLLTCDTSPCLKRLGQHLGVRHVARVQVVVTGNSYRMSARIFKTTGAAPAALPVETQSRFCDVCTVTEAREAMLRLADGIRVPDEPNLVGLAPARAPAPAPTYRKGAIAAMVVGLAGIVAGTIALAASGEGGKGLPAIGGGLMGAGALSTVGGLFFYGESLRRPASAEAPSRR